MIGVYSDWGRETPGEVGLRDVGWAGMPVRTPLLSSVGTGAATGHCVERC